MPFSHQLELTSYYALLALGTGPKSHAEISEQIAADSNSVMQIRRNTLYQTLTRLTAGGLIEQLGGVGRNRTYRLTGRGHNRLKRESIALYQASGHGIRRTR